MLEKKDYEEIAHLMRVIVESDLSPKLDLLFEKLDGLEERMVEPSELDGLKDRLDVLESVVRTHSRDIAYIHMQIWAVLFIIFLCRNPVCDREL